MGSGSERRRSERISLDAGVDFFVDAEIVGARAIDVSQTGLRFSSPEPLEIEISLNVDGEREERTARLVWAEMQPDGAMQYGLEFVEDEDEYVDEDEGPDGDYESDEFDDDDI